MRTIHQRVPTGVFVLAALLVAGTAPFAGAQTLAPGTPIGPEIVADQSTVGNDPQLDWTEPDIAPSANGGFTVTWGRSPVNNALPNDVLLRRYDSLGTALGAPVTVNNPAGVHTHMEWGRLASARNGRLVVAWQGSDATRNARVYARAFTADGASITGNIVVDQEISSQTPG